MTLADLVELALVIATVVVIPVIMGLYLVRPWALVTSKLRALEPQRDAWRDANPGGILLRTSPESQGIFTLKEELVRRTESAFWERGDRSLGVSAAWREALLENWPELRDETETTHSARKTAS